MSKTINNLLFATAGVLFAQVIGSLRSFVLARLIEPNDYGIWTALQLIVTLSPIVCLGAVEALLKQVPFFRGKNDPAGLRRIEESVFATMAISAALVAGLFLAAGRWLPFRFVHDNLMLAQLTASAAAISLFTAFYYHRCAAYEDFRSVSLIDSLQSLASFTCVLGLGWKWGLAGAAVGYFLGECVTWAWASFLCGRRHGSVSPGFQPTLMGRAVRVGFPITIIWWVYALQTTVGRMVAISFLGNIPTGYYGAGSSMAMLFALVPNTIGRVFYPRINAQVGQKAGLHGIRESVVMPTAAMAFAIPVAQIVVFYLLPLVYNDFLPKYKAGLTCGQILILGAFFVGLIRNGANYLIAVDLQMRLMKYVMLSLVANTVGCLVFVSLGFGINGIAVAASLASALLASLIWRRVFLELGYERKSQLNVLANFYLPFLATLLAIALVNVGFSGVSGYSRVLVPVKMVLALLLCGGLIMSFANTREQMRDIGRRAWLLVAFRFRQPAAK